MQRRLSSVGSIFKGINLIFSASLELQLRNLIRIWTISTVREDILNRLGVCSKHKPDLTNTASYVLDRLSLINQQNLILLRSLLVPSLIHQYDCNHQNHNSDAMKGDKASKDSLESQNLSTSSPTHVNTKLRVPIENPNSVDSPLSLHEPHPATYIPTNQRTISSRERRVPSSRIGRVTGFGNLAISLGLGAAAEWTKRAVGYSESKSTYQNPFLSDANLERIVDTLCRMRGAALKVGQMLSIQDENLVSPQLHKIFERVRQSADFMPSKQMRKVLNAELGENWQQLVKDFEEKPFAAASIGQVHRAKLEDGRVIAMKIQYPGIADSIDADVNNLMLLLKRFNILPRGLFADKAIEVAKRELSNECNYLREAEYAKKFADLLRDDPIFYVPKIIDNLTTTRVLTADYAEGLVLDDCVNLPSDIRNWLGEQLLRLCLHELFVYRVMQTDPNWSNFLYNPKTGKIVLLDFGASREYDKSFVDIYIRLIHAASQRDRHSILQLSKALGFLTGYETKAMEQAHTDAVVILGEAFASLEPFDFGAQSTSKDITHLIPVLLEHRLTPPPEESYSLHRKMSGCFLLCGKLKAKVNCRPLFYQIWNNYKFS